MRVSVNKTATEKNEEKELSQSAKSNIIFKWE